MTEEPSATHFYTLNINLIEAKGSKLMQKKDATSNPNQKMRQLESKFLEKLKTFIMHYELAEAYI